MHAPRCAYCCWLCYYGYGHCARKGVFLFYSSLVLFCGILLQQAACGFNLYNAADLVSQAITPRWIVQEGALDAEVQKAVDEGADVVMTSGGVSMGDTDYVKPMLEKMGTVHFGRVLMKPGKPLTFATLAAEATERTVLYFGLPGVTPATFL
jgi:hypothetical protein